MAASEWWARAILFVGAAAAEIAGCWVIWLWWRGGAPAWMPPLGLALLALFAWLLALSPGDAAGRAFAAYGGVYIVTALAWLLLVERRMPDAWDLGGAALCLVGAGLIAFAPRG